MWQYISCGYRHAGAFSLSYYPPLSLIAYLLKYFYTFCLPVYLTDKSLSSMHSCQVSWSANLIMYRFYLSNACLARYLSVSLSFCLPVYLSIYLFISLYLISSLSLPISICLYLNNTTACTAITIFLFQ